MVDTLRCVTSNVRVSLVDEGDRPTGICSDVCFAVLFCILPPKENKIFKQFVMFEDNNK
jgi:hypothetical protein